MRIMDNYDSRHRKKKFLNLPDEVPNEKLDRAWALKVHSQTLERLNERGGMTITEMIMNLKRWSVSELLDKYGYNYEATQKDADELEELISK